MDDPRIIALRDQFETLMLLLVRPVVQRQVFYFLLVLLIAWLVPIPYRMFVRWLARRNGVSLTETETSDQPPTEVSWQERLVRMLRALEFIFFPVAGLLLGGAVIGYMNRNGMPSGLILRLIRLFWILLAYRVVAAVLYASIAPEMANRYRRRFVAPVFAVLFAASLTIGLAGIFPLGEIELFRFMGQSLSLRSIALAITILYLTFAFAWIVRDILHRFVLPRTSADSGVTHTIELVTHYMIIGFGVFISANVLGLDLTALLVIFGGLSVGIGFGLQELVANFISGILLVFEQTLRPGDVVEVGGQRGTVTEMRMRSTVLRNIDNIELFVPNKTLLTSNVAAYTMSDRVLRRIVQVGVSYDSDPSQVRNILLDIADRHGLVLDDPPPTVFFTNFGDSSLDFELAVFIDEPMRVLSVLSDIRFMIFSDFAKHNIQIPFPQRDINFSTPLALTQNGQVPETADADANGEAKQETAGKETAAKEATDKDGAPTDPSRLP